VQLTDKPDVVGVSALRNYVEACIVSISRTDSRTVEETVRTFDVSVTIVSVFSVEITVLVNGVFAVWCPGQPVCSGHGSCVNALCVCDAGN